jgi:HEAT repeat protein
VTVEPLCSGPNQIGETVAERTIAELVERLNSGDPMDRVFAAEELGERGDHAAVQPLVATLSGLTYEVRADFGLATAIIEALASLDASDAAGTIVDALRKTCGDDVVPEVACGALVRLRAKGSVPLLRELRRRREFADHADELERTIDALMAMDP